MFRDPKCVQFQCQTNLNSGISLAVESYFYLVMFNHLYKWQKIKRFQVPVLLFCYFDKRAEPMKKKKRLDPMLEKQKLEKKKKKIMKEIKRLQKLDKQLKPIADVEIPECLVHDLERRTRTITVPEEVAENRIRLFKEWSKYKLLQNVYTLQLLQRLTKAQQQALDELRVESEELYQAAVQIDPKLIPLKYSGPTETPPKEDYSVPDGAYVDVSKKWI